MQAALPTPLPIPVNMGGTGAVTAALARLNLGIESGIYKKVATEAELIAALAAEEPRILITADITATQDYSVTEDTEIKVGSRCTLNMGGSYGIVVDAGYYFELTGQSRDVSFVTWNASGAPHDLVQLGAGAGVRFADIKITESATSGNAGVIATTARNSTIERCAIVFANDTTQRLPAQTGAVVNNVLDCIFTGGGSSCAYKSNPGSCTGFWRDIYINGTWLGASGWFAVGNNNSVVRGVYVQVTGPNTNHQLSVLGGIVSGVYATGVGINFFNASGLFSQIYTGNITISLYARLTTFSVGAITFNSGSVFLSNGTVGSSLTLTVDGISADNVIFSANLTISSGADDNRFSACDVGNVIAPGSGAAFTINAGANRTVITGCRTDNAIVDGGTGTVTAGNSIF